MWFQGELEHRRVKRFYARTNKRNFTRQITKLQQREEKLRHINERARAAAQARRRGLHSSAQGPEGVQPSVPEGVQAAAPDGGQSSESSTQEGRQQSRSMNENGAAVPFEAEEPLGPSSPDKHYHICSAARFSEDINQWLLAHKDDAALAVRDFVVRTN